MGCVKEVLWKTPLSITPGGSPDVNGCVASQTREDFTVHLEMHPLKHLLCGIQCFVKFQRGVMCINPTLHHPNKPRLQEHHESSKHLTKHRRGLNADRKRHKHIIKLKNVDVGNFPLTSNVLHKEQRCCMRRRRH